MRLDDSVKTVDNSLPIALKLPKSIFPVNLDGCSPGLEKKKIKECRNKTRDGREGIETETQRVVETGTRCVTETATETEAVVRNAAETTAGNTSKCVAQAETVTETEAVIRNAAETKAGNTSKCVAQAETFQTDRQKAGTGRGTH